eukprot:4489312-Lingulodinium_polyedra.AAC.1
MNITRANLESSVGVFWAPSGTFASDPRAVHERAPPPTVEPDVGPVPHSVRITKDALGKVG